MHLRHQGGHNSSTESTKKNLGPPKVTRTRKWVCLKPGQYFAGVDGTISFTVTVFFFKCKNSLYFSVITCIIAPNWKQCQYPSREGSVRLYLGTYLYLKIPHPWCYWHWIPDDMDGVLKHMVKQKKPKYKWMSSVEVHLSEVWASLADLW